MLPHETIYDKKSTRAEHIVIALLRNKWPPAEWIKTESYDEDEKGINHLISISTDSTYNTNSKKWTQRNWNHFIVL